MSKMSPSEMAKILAKGLLSFPVTHFDRDLRFQEGPYREHCAWLLGFKRLTGLFAAGGTGEFFSLSPAEVGQVVAAAVKETDGRTPSSRAAAMARQSQSSWPNQPRPMAPTAFCSCRPI